MGSGSRDIPAEKIAGRYWLLPHERWLGRLVGRVGPPQPGGQARAVEQNYGRGGQLLLAAAAADLITAFVVGFIGVILLFALGRDGGSVAAAGYWLLGLAILSCVICIGRGLQGAHEGRVYRAGRPFVRPGRR
jgi:hypothetical protein